MAAAYSSIVRYPYFIIARGPLLQAVAGSNPLSYQAYYRVLTTEPAVINHTLEFTAYKIGSELVAYGAPFVADDRSGFQIDTALRGPASTYSAMGADVEGLADLFSVLGDLKYFFTQDPVSGGIRSAWVWMADVTGAADGVRLTGYPTGQPPAAFPVAAAIPFVTIDTAAQKFSAVTPSAPASAFGLPAVSAPFQAAHAWCVSSTGAVTWPDVQPRDVLVGKLGTTPSTPPQACGAATVGVGAAPRTCGKADCGDLCVTGSCVVDPHDATKCKCDCTTGCGPKPCLAGKCLQGVDSAGLSQCQCKDCSCQCTTCDDACQCDCTLPGQCAHCDAGHCVKVGTGCKCNECDATSCTTPCTGTDVCGWNEQTGSCGCLSACRDSDCDPTKCPAGKCKRGSDGTCACDCTGAQGCGGNACTTCGPSSDKSFCACDCTAGCVPPCPTGKTCAWDATQHTCSCQASVCTAGECGGCSTCTRGVDGTCDCTCGTADCATGCVSCVNSGSGAKSQCVCDCDKPGACDAKCQTTGGTCTPSKGASLSGCVCDCTGSSTCGTCDPPGVCAWDASNSTCKCTGSQDGSSPGYGPILQGQALLWGTPTPLAPLAAQLGVTTTTVDPTLVGVTYASAIAPPVDGDLSAGPVPLSQVRHPGQVWRAYSVEPSGNVGGAFPTNLKPMGTNAVYSQCNVYTPRVPGAVDCAAKVPAPATGSRSVFDQAAYDTCVGLNSMVAAQASWAPTIAGSGWRIGRDQLRSPGPESQEKSSSLVAPYNDTSVPAPGTLAQSDANRWIASAAAQWPVGLGPTRFNGTLTAGGSGGYPVDQLTTKGLLPGIENQSPAVAQCNCPVGVVGPGCEARLFASTTQPCSAGGPQPADATWATLAPMCSGLGVIDDCQLAPSVLGRVATDPYATSTLADAGVALNGMFLSCQCPVFQLDPQASRWPNPYIVWMDGTLIKKLSVVRSIAKTTPPAVFNTMLSQGWCNTFVNPVDPDAAPPAAGAFDVSSDVAGKDGNPNRAWDPWSCDSESGDCTLQTGAQAQAIDWGVAHVPPLYSGIVDSDGAALSNAVIDPTVSVHDLIYAMRNETHTLKTPLMGLSWSVIADPQYSDLLALGSPYDSADPTKKHEMTLLWGSTYGLMQHALSRASVTLRPYVPNLVDDCLMALGTASATGLKVWQGEGAGTLSSAEIQASWRLAALTDPIVGDDSYDAVPLLGQIMPPVHASRRQVGDLPAVKLVLPPKLVPVTELFPKLVFGDRRSQQTVLNPPARWRYGVGDSGRLWVLAPYMNTSPLADVTAEALAAPHHPWAYTVVSTTLGSPGTSVTQIVVDDSQNVWSLAEEAQEMPVLFWSTNYSEDPTDGVDVTQQAAQIYCTTSPAWTLASPSSYVDPRSMGVDAHAYGASDDPAPTNCLVGTSRYVRSPHFRYIMGDLLNQGGTWTNQWGDTGSATATAGLSGYTTHRVCDDVLLNPALMRSAGLDTATFMFDCGTLVVACFANDVSLDKAGAAADAMAALFYSKLDTDAGVAAGTMAKRWPVPPPGTAARDAFVWSEVLPSVSTLGPAEALIAYEMSAKYSRMDTLTHSPWSTGSTRPWLVNSDSLYAARPADPSKPLSPQNPLVSRPFFAARIVWYCAVSDDPAAKVQAAIQKEYVCTTKGCALRSAEPEPYFPSIDACNSTCAPVGGPTNVAQFPNSQCRNPAATTDRSSVDTSTQCEVACQSAEWCEALQWNPDLPSDQCWLYPSNACGDIVDNPSGSGVSVWWDRTLGVEGTHPTATQPPTNPISQSACVEQCLKDPTCRAVSVGTYSVDPTSECRLWATADTTAAPGRVLLAPPAARALGAATSQVGDTPSGPKYPATGSGIVIPQATFVIAEYLTAAWSQPNVSTGACDAARQQGQNPLSGVPLSDVGTYIDANLLKPFPAFDGDAFKTAGTNPNRQFTSPLGTKLLQFWSGTQLRVVDADASAVWTGPAMTTEKFTQVYWCQNLYNQSVISAYAPDFFAGVGSTQVQNLCLATMSVEPPRYTADDQRLCWDPQTQGSGCPALYRPLTPLGEPIEKPSCALPPAAPIVPVYAMPVCPCYLGALEVQYTSDLFQWAGTDAHLPMGVQRQHPDPVAGYVAAATADAGDGLGTLIVCNTARCEYAYGKTAQFTGGEGSDANKYWQQSCKGISNSTSICIQEVDLPPGDLVNNANITIQQSCYGDGPTPPTPFKQWGRWLLIGLGVAAVLGIVLGVVLSARKRKVTKAQILQALGTPPTKATPQQIKAPQVRASQPVKTIQSKPPAPPAKPQPAKPQPAKSQPAKPQRAKAPQSKTRVSPPQPKKPSAPSKQAAKPAPAPAGPATAKTTT